MNVKVMPAIMIMMTMEKKMFEEVLEAVMNEISYDTREGIQKYLDDGLAGLNRLIRDRSRAGYKENKRMKTWIILGRWVADSCGNFGKIIDIDYKQGQAPKDLYPDMIDILSFEELRNVLGKISISHGFQDDVPDTHLRCPECNNSWNIYDCHDVIVKRESLTLPLAEFEGQKLYEVQREVSLKTDGFYRFGESPIRNDKWIDMAIEPGYEVLKINEQGSIHSSPEKRSFKDQLEGLKDQHLYYDYVISEGDEGWLDVWKYYHRPCNEAKAKKDAEEYYGDMLVKSGWATTMCLIPNEYSVTDHSWPWIKFCTLGGMIKVGYRKRVINIDWSDTKQHYRHLFEDEGVTLTDTYVHAWGKDKAIEYLTKIREADVSQN